MLNLHQTTRPWSFPGFTFRFQMELQYFFLQQQKHQMTPLLSRGTQRICSSLYLLPRGILLAGQKYRCSDELARNYWLYLAFQPELAVETLETEDDWKKQNKQKQGRTPSLSQRVVTNIRQLVRVIALGQKTCFVPVLPVWIEQFESARRFPQIVITDCAVFLIYMYD